MMLISSATALLALLMLGQQQQVAHGWWFFPGSAEPPKQPAAPAPVQAPVPVAVQVPAGPYVPAVPAATARNAQPGGAYQPAKAIANFDMDGVRGFIKFSQTLESAPTQVEYDLTGLQGNNKLYHVHVRPVPKFDAELIKGNATARAQLCGDPATGGHLNPHHVTQKLPPQSAPLDKYETGDLSGKHGPFQLDASQADHYKGAYADDKLPMWGEHSIIGRSVVIHKNDGARWVCASIERQ